MFKAAIFDWDGVVIDSSDIHRKCWELLAAEKGFSVKPGSFERGFGRKNEFIIPNILGWTNKPTEILELGDRKEELYREILKTDGIKPLPGAIELFDGLKANGIPMAVGTSTPRANVDCVIDLIGAKDYFDCIISAENVTNGKPNPEVFLKCAEGLGVDPINAVVFEDAEHGIEAAQKAGMKAIALTTTQPMHAFAEFHPNVVIETLDDLTVNDLKHLW